MAASHIARRLPQQNGPAAWDAILGPRAAHAPFQGAEKADFVIVGGGFAGLSAARRLTQLAPSARIAVVEAGQIGQGAAGRNSGFMIDLPHELTSDNYAGADTSLDHRTIALNRAAIGFAAEAVAEYGISPEFFRRDGKVNGAASETAHAQNLSYAKHLGGLGEPHEMLDRQAMETLTGSTHYRSGLYTPGTVMLQPAGYVRGLAEGLARQGVRFYENSPVTALDRQGSAWRVRTTGGALSAGQVILATNGHLESFGFMRGRLMHVFLFACMTKELDPATVGGAPCWGITPSDPMGTTVRRISTAQGGNRIVTRTIATMQPEMTTTPRQLAKATAVMQRKFDQRFPKLKGTAMEYAWAGHLCLSTNHVSVTGALDDNLYAACVQNGLGTARGTLTGICAAEQAIGHQSPITEFFATEAQPKRLPPEPFAHLGANMFIRWKEWHAKEE